MSRCVCGHANHKGKCGAFLLTTLSGYGQFCECLPSLNHDPTEPKCSCVGTIDPNCPRGHGRTTEPAESEGKWQLRLVCLDCDGTFTDWHESRCVCGHRYRPNPENENCPECGDENYDEMCPTCHDGVLDYADEITTSPTAPVDATEEAKAFPLPENEQDFIVRTMERLNELQYRQMARFAEQYAAKRLEAERERIVELENALTSILKSPPDQCKWIAQRAMQAVKARGGKE